MREAGVLPVYSNYGAGLAGEAVSWVNGHPFQDIVETEITRPLGLDHTTFREPYPPRADLPAPMPASLAGEVSTGYRWAGGGLQPERFEYLSQAAPSDSASSSAGDMARYMLMILNGGQLDSASLYGPDIARGFRTASASAAPGVNGFDDGFMAFSLPGGYRGQGHGGDTLWFHSELVTVPRLNGARACSSPPTPTPANRLATGTCPAASSPASTPRPAKRREAARPTWPTRPRSTTGPI